MAEQASEDVSVIDILQNHLDTDSDIYDIDRACAELEKLSSMGDAEAQYLFSLFLYAGISSAQDRTSALEHMKAA